MITSSRQASCNKQLRYYYDFRSPGSAFITSTVGNSLLCIVEV